jgi:hypothetical protein
MTDYRLKAWGEEFTLNNNSGKFDRTAQEVGDKATPEAFLATYDKLGGLILDKDKKKMENGIFEKRYSQWKDEQPQYIKTLEERERTLDEGEKRTIELISKHIDHKRAFLGTLMTISAAVLAGLFILFSGKDTGACINTLATISGLGFSLFIIFSSFYLTFLLAQESLSLDKNLHFVRDSRKDFIEKVGIAITDLDSYERYRGEKNKEEKNSRPKEKGLWEGWFVIVSGLFILSTIIVLGLFLSSLLDGCSLKLLILK